MASSGQNGRCMRQLAILFALAMAAVAQERPLRSSEILNTITVDADGQVEGEPDIAQLRFDISAQDKSARDVHEKVSKSAEQIRALLRENGVDPGLAHVGALYFQPVFDYKGNKRKIVGYHAGSAVTIKLQDFSKIGPLLQQLAEGDFAESQSLSYILSNVDATKTRAVENAMQKALAEATAAAKAAGANVGTLISANVDVREQVRPLLRPLGGLSTLEGEGVAANGAVPLPAPTADFTPQGVTINAHVHAVFSLK